MGWDGMGWDRMGRGEMDGMGMGERDGSFEIFFFFFPIVCVCVCVIVILCLLLFCTATRNGCRGRGSSTVFSVKCIFPKPLQPIDILVPNMGSLREYSVAEATNPLYVRVASIAGRQRCSPLFRESSRCVAPTRIRRQRPLVLAVFARGAGPLT